MGLYERSATCCSCLSLELDIQLVLLGGVLFSSNNYLHEEITVNLKVRIEFVSNGEDLMAIISP